MSDPKLWEWLEDLKWCPSQIEYYFTDQEGLKWLIYLRWRHSDSWTAELIPLNDKWEEQELDSWETLETGRKYKALEYQELEHEILEKIKRKFPAVKFP